MFQKMIARTALVAGLLAPMLAFAANSLCPDHYAGGRAPEIRNPKLAVATRELCYGVFGVMHSGVTRTPLWSAEHLRAENVAAAQGLKRDNAFHPEPRLPRSQRAELDDYARSGYDRGHMTPNGDMPDRVTQRESFTLANMVPQDGDHNRHIWAPIEGAVRKMAKKEGELYVITGPAYLGTNVRKIGNVLVPTHLYKVVYSPRQGRAAAWFTENKANADIQVIPVAELERILGIEFLPSLTQQQKERMLALPRIRAKQTNKEPKKYVFPNLFS
ncbi:DNA/RNA non-specific endonuclease [Massilia sp. Mn16-1_5]|uniref:DNA/RNA non-specific endonuclease n=1 Tax=Massilia sp. Mn16-1_5 TaxID=2079199 RepID=UPI00109E6034|nr:DNA/RNA non-specific endonuclease [Massilia sp. Mn16-1_5]THC46816.1 DNA/RNA non-specific endonuclease [Massilia sp. Mn16-1_5]